MSEPKRIQRRRTRGYRLPPNAVYVGRPTKWGNPYNWQDAAEAGYENPRACAVEMYRHWLRGDLAEVIRCGAPPTPTEIQTLAGADLACWCPLPEPGQPDHCHAAVLLELANAARAPEDGR